MGRLTPKNWGFEDEIVNKEYCGKRMFVKEQHRCSIHHHAVKDEVLYVGQGCLYFETGDKPDNMIGVWLQDNESIHLSPLTWHRFTALRDTLIFEFSTHHEDEDSIRHVMGGKAGDDEFRALRTAFLSHQNVDRILNVETARIMSAGMKADGRSIGMVNGCFDVLHPGHLHLLQQAKTRCDCLFVVVNTDAAVRKLKGDRRPVNNEAFRFSMLAANKFVDYVVAEDNSTCLLSVEAIRPDVYVTSSEHGPTGPEARQALHQGARIEVVDMIPGLSSSSLINKAAQGK